MNPNTPTQPPEEPLRPHVYDGIREFDKRLPNWWLFTFYATIVFWVGYWGYYEWLHVGPNNHQRIEKAIASIEAEKLAATASTKLDNASLWQMSRNPVFVEAGRATFNSICATCHKESLRGSRRRRHWGQPAARSLDPRRKSAGPVQYRHQRRPRKGHAGLGPRPRPEEDHRGRGLRPQLPPRGRADVHPASRRGEMRIGRKWSSCPAQRLIPSRPSVRTAPGGSCIPPTCTAVSRGCAGFPASS